jgi:hypothetical protein
MQLADILLDLERIKRTEGHWTDKYFNHPQKELEHEIFERGNAFGWWTRLSPEESNEIIQNVASLLYSEAQVL